MKILLASSPHADTFGYSMPPPGLLRLGGALRDAGHDPRLEDLAYRMAAGDLDGGDGLVHSAVRWLAALERPDVFGLSVMGATLPAALAIAERLREHWPKTPFLLGGPGMNGTDVAVLERFPFIDGVVLGEGELTLVELLDELAQAPSTRDLPALRGMTVRIRGPLESKVVNGGARPMIQDLGALPAYAWDLLPPISSYKQITGEEDGLVPLDSGRGCVFDCSFCSIGRTWSRRSRPLPAPRLVEEIAALRDIPGAKRAYLCHDIFGADRGHALEFTERMGEQGVEIPWEVRARVDHLDAELLLAMGKAGCDRVLLGIESASHAVRARNQKGMKADVDVLAAVSNCAAAGITPILSLILGLPGESDDDLDASLTLCAEAALGAGVNLSLHLVNPQPGTALGDEYGASSRPVEGVPPDMALGAGLCPEERALIDAHPDLFSTWALLPHGPDALEELKFLSREFPEALMRFPRTFAALLAEWRRRDAHGRAGRGALAVARAWREDGRTFGTFAKENAGGALPLVEALHRWEVLQIRVSARGARSPFEARYRLNAELFDTDTPLLEAARQLGEELALGPRAQRADFDDEAPPRSSGDTRATYAVVAPPPLPGHLRGIRTLKLSGGIASLVRALDSEDSAPEALSKISSSPRARLAVDDLVQRGVLLAPRSGSHLGAHLAPSPPATT